MTNKLTTTLLLFLVKISFSQCVVLNYQTDANQFGNVFENNTTNQFDQVLVLKENTTQITFTNTKSCGENFDKFLFYNRTQFNANPGAESNYRLFLMDQLVVNVDTLTMQPNGTSDTLYIKVSNGFGSILNSRKIRIVRKIQVTGLESLTSNPWFSIYPNPAQDKLTFAFKIPIGEQDVFITDVHGKKIMVLNEEDVNGFTNTLELGVHDWEDGIYFVCSGNYCEKILVTR